MRKAIPLILASLLAACATPPVTQTTPAPKAVEVDPLAAHLAQRDVELLQVYLEGTWETIPQLPGYGDSTPIRLRMTRLWPERASEGWMYAEYVKAEDDRQALRQRIFRFHREGARVIGSLYRVPGDPAAAVGEWRKERPFGDVDPSTLKEIEGCRTVWLKQIESLFAAGTDGKTCRGDSPAVVDEHSDFYLASSSLRSHVRGLDASGKQVEGPTGPSEFRKTALKPS